jgi:density-regulated protein DRP1
MMIYVKGCNLPPEYCSFGQKDITACKEWLEGAHPVLYEQVYGEAPKIAAVDKENKTEEAEEEKKGEDGEEKPKKKVKFNKELGVITIHKQKRGGKKTVCQMLGFEYYTKDLKSLASKLSKKFACGCNVASDDILGECISIQGDVEYTLEELLEDDKDLKKLEVPIDKIRYEEMGNKKGRKRG